MGSIDIHIEAANLSHQMPERRMGIIRPRGWHETCSALIHGLYGSGDVKELTVNILLATRRCEMQALAQLQRAVLLVSAVRGLVHELQRERGASNLYLGSAGRNHGEVMMVSRQASDQALAAWAEEMACWSRPEACVHARSRLLGRLAVAMHALDGLESLRSEVQCRRLGVMQAVQAYGEIIKSLLSVAFEAADTDAEVEISRELLALINLMQGKELAGQERAIGAAGFSQGEFDEELQQALAHRIDAQAHSFEVFVSFASEQAGQAWQELVHSTRMTELEQLRRLARSNQLSEQASSRNAANWFERASWRIDAMRELEDSMEKVLLERCEQRMAEGRAGLLSDEEQLKRLETREGQGAGSYAVFFDAPGQPEERVPPGQAIPGHAIMELVQHQAKRLQTVEDELRTARQALRERKLIERAKALLMQQQHLPEERAYQLMRQTAMNQNRRLAEVAEMILMLDHKGTRTRM